MRVMIMEDDIKTISFINLGLEMTGWIVDVAYDSDTAERLMFKNNYDVIVLDVIVPGINGFELCKKIRNQNINSPVLMLTSLDSLDDKMRGFENGADDYLIKPFQMKELIARIKALGRRNQSTYMVPLLKIADIQLDVMAKKVTKNNQDIRLTATEFKILELLMLQKNKVLDRIQIADKIWGVSFNSGTNVIDVHINSLRKKINDHHPYSSIIKTIIGMGYVIYDNH